jgi:hypothetical protein
VRVRAQWTGDETVPNFTSAGVMVGVREGRQPALIASLPCVVSDGEGERRLGGPDCQWGMGARERERARLASGTGWQRERGERAAREGARDDGLGWADEGGEGRARGGWAGVERGQGRPS